MPKFHALAWLVLAGVLLTACSDVIDMLPRHEADPWAEPAPVVMAKPAPAPAAVVVPSPAPPPAKPPAKPPAVKAVPPEPKPEPKPKPVVRKPEPAPVKVVKKAEPPPPPPLPPPPISTDLLGLEPGGLRDLLGMPRLQRRERPGEVWQYAGEVCVLHVFLYEDKSDTSIRVDHLEATDLSGQRTDTDPCLADLAVGTIEGRLE